MKKNIQYKKRDDYSTPKEAFVFAFKHLPKDKIVWDPFYCEGDSGKFLKEMNINCIHENTNFFETDISFDIIVTNPPYSIKQKVINHCYKLGKPFAILIPLESLERGYLHNKEFSILIPKKRYSFKQGNVTPPFKTAWFCFNMDLPKQIIYEI
jgi:hypothetical protein